MMIDRILERKWINKTINTGKLINICFFNLFILSFNETCANDAPTTATTTAQRTGSSIFSDRSIPEDYIINMKIVAELSWYDSAFSFLILGFRIVRLEFVLAPGYCWSQRGESLVDGGCDSFSFCNFINVSHSFCLVEFSTVLRQSFNASLLLKTTYNSCLDRPGAPLHTGLRVRVGTGGWAVAWAFIRVQCHVCCIGVSFTMCVMCGNRLLKVQNYAWTR